MAPQNLFGEYRAPSVMTSHPLHHGRHRVTQVRLGEIIWHSDAIGGVGSIGGVRSTEACVDPEISAVIRVRVRVVNRSGNTRNWE